MFDLRRVEVAETVPLFERCHGYGGVGKVGTYAFGVFEDTGMVAAFVWNPPAPGCAKVVSPGEPQGALALVRMVAVPKDERTLKHISKPLMVQMKRSIDRGRWPVLVTFSDAGQGHTGYVYACSGWTKTVEVRRQFGVDEQGVRRSKYSGGGRSTVVMSGTTTLTRWEHHACPTGAEGTHMREAGWVRVPTGKTWRSGAPAFTWRHLDP